MTSVTIPSSLSTIGDNAFIWCFNLDTVNISNLAAWCGISFYWTANPLYYGANLYLRGEKVTDLVIPEGVASIGDGAFRGCSSLISVTIPNSINNIGEYAFEQCRGLTNVISQIEEPFEMLDNVFEMYNDEPYERYFTPATLYVRSGCKARYESTAGWKRFSKIIEHDYRPFVEEGKVWKVGSTIDISDNLVKMVEYFYFDGDTIIDGKTCKQMMCQRYFNPDFSDDYWTQLPSLSKVGAWYEEDKKVYNYVGKQFMTMYDFSLEANETMDFVLSQYDGCPPCIIRPKQTGGLNGFKGVYRDIMWLEGEGTNYCTTWLEGVGGIQGPTANLGDGQLRFFLMSCTVGDEVIYLNDEYEDGATPEEARKKRFDFTHTIKIQPKAPIKREKSDVYINSSEREVARPKVKSRIRKGEEQSLYGEYNDLKLGINLDPLDDDYQVSISDESGKVVYEKVVNAGSIVGLNIDISAYTKGRYTVTVENSSESFTGVFETLPTGIKEIRNNKEEIRTEIYNLQGQRLSSLQKGLNIVNGQKIVIKD